jgi:predicted metal-binding membrane protein
MPLKLAITLSTVIATAWAFLIFQSWQMAQLPMAQMWMPPARLVAWPLAELLVVFAMWAVMMAAMMLPSIFPVMKAFIRYTDRDPAANYWYTLWFGSGYLSIWVAFSALLTGMQWLFHGLTWLSPMMENNQTSVAAVIFILAGIYQFSPQKNACLQYCRMPFGFLLQQWRSGKLGAFMMGMNHGSSCLGCCWAQMLIMFAVGIMNIAGMAMITILVILEKGSMISTKKLSYGSGLAFLVWGFWLAFR